jgi:predicted RNA-binding protein
MCESTVFVEEKDTVHEVLRDVARIWVDGEDVVCTSVIGERVVLKNVRLKEANLLSHGIVFVRD